MRSGFKPRAAHPATRLGGLLEDGHFNQARAVLKPRVKANTSDAEAAALFRQEAEAAIALDPKLIDAREGMITFSQPRGGEEGFASCTFAVGLF